MCYNQWRSGHFILITDIVNCIGLKFGENVTILIIVVVLQNVWQIKFCDLVKFAKLLSYTLLAADILANSIIGTYIVKTSSYPGLEISIRMYRIAWTIRA